MQVQISQYRQAQTLAQASMSQADADRKQQQSEAWKAYQGQFQKPLKVDANQPDDNVLSNRCASIVDKGVSFLFGQKLEIVCDEQDFVDGLWGDDDDRMTLLCKIATNGGSFGQFFLKLIPPQGDMPYPRIVNLDPRLIRIVSDPEDCDLHLAYIIEYAGVGDIQKRQIIARVDPNADLEIAGQYDREDTWTIANYVRRSQSERWQQVGEVEEWLYPFAPIFTNQNLPNPNEPWGKPDLTPDLVQLNKVLNFIQSNTSRIIKYHAHPKTWGKGFRASQMTTAVDDLFVIEAPDGTLQNLEMTSNLESSRAFANDIRADMDEQSRVPAVALGRLADLPRGQISGVALQLLFQPLLEKTIQKQRLYGCTIRAITRAALVLVGKLSIEEYEDYPVELHWQPLLPTDNLAAAQEAILLQQLGVSRETIYSGLGLNAEEEAERKAQEDQEKITAFSRGQGFPPVPPQQQMMQGQQGNQTPSQPGSEQQ